MAQCPALLIYTSDFIVATSTLSDTQVGKLIRLLFYQHQVGHITKKAMKKLCPRTDEDILAFFKIDEDGCYYNERVEADIAKRESFVNSRIKNASGKKSTRKDKKEPKKQEHDAQKAETVKQKDSCDKTQCKTREETKKESDKCEKKQKHGAFKNVLLTEEEYSMLKEKFPHDIEERIDDLSYYISSKGNAYKSHYAAILSLARKKDKERVDKEPSIKKESSFDTDEFFQAALARSEKMLREKCGF